MHVPLLILLVYLAALMQTTVCPLAAVGAVMPDMFSLAAVAWLFLGRGPRGFLSAGCIGLAADLLSPGLVGAGVASYLIVGYALCGWLPWIEADRLWIRLLATGLTTWVVSVAPALAAGLNGACPLDWHTVIARPLAEALYTTAVSLPIWMLVGWIRRGERFDTVRSRLASD